MKPMQGLLGKRYSWDSRFDVDTEDTNGRNLQENVGTILILFTCAQLYYYVVKFLSVYTDTPSTNPS